jgi:hypothetical protein
MVLSIHLFIYSFIHSFIHSVLRQVHRLFESEWFRHEGYSVCKKDCLLRCNALLPPPCLQTFEKNCCFNYPPLYCRQHVSVMWQVREHHIAEGRYHLKANSLALNAWNQILSPSIPARKQVQSIILNSIIFLKLFFSVRIIWNTKTNLIG